MYAIFLHQIFGYERLALTFNRCHLLILIVNSHVTLLSLCLTGCLENGNVSFCFHTFMNLCNQLSQYDVLPESTSAGKYQGQ